MFNPSPLQDKASSHNARAKAVVTSIIKRAT